MFDSINNLILFMSEFSKYILSFAESPTRFCVANNFRQKCQLSRFSRACLSIASASVHSV